MYINNYNILDSHTTYNLGIISNHNFLEGSTWLKCSHWQERISIFTRGMEHEKQMLFFVGYFD
jgi:hypothetical protein